MHTVALIALPVVYAAYLGVAEAARELALAACKKRKEDPSNAYLVGEMESELSPRRSRTPPWWSSRARRSPVRRRRRRSSPAAASSASAVLRTVEKALEVAGGGGFYRAATIERLFRDVQAARYHPLPDRPRQRLIGRVALGLDIDG